MNKKKKIIIPIVTILLIYLIGVLFFSLYTYPKTKINDETLGIVNRQKYFEEDASSLQVLVKGKDDLEAKIPAKSIAFTMKVPNNFQIKDNGFLWPIKVFTAHHYSVDYDINYQEDKLDSLLEGADLFSKAEQPTNAKVVLEGDEYEIVPEEEGNMPKLEVVKEKVLKALQGKVEKVNLEEEDYLKPEITQEDETLQAEKTRLNEMAKTQITLDLTSEKVELKGQDLINLYDETEEGFVLNDDRLREFVGQIAARTDTLGKKREFETTGVGIVTIDGGVYGWQINVDETKEKLKEMILAGESAEIEPIYLRRGLTRTEDDDIGDTYIEIDLTRQHLWFYKDGELVTETDIVTGNVARGQETEEGAYIVWSRETDRYLKGPGYNVHVNYWLPINWAGIGLHDTYYRNAYGGTIYQNDGSNGCINMPEANAKAIYENVKNNTPVLIYKS